MLRQRIHTLFNGPIADKFLAIERHQGRAPAIDYVLQFFNAASRPRYAAEFAALAAKDEQIDALREQIVSAQAAKPRGWSTRVRELRVRIRAIEGRQ